MFQSPRFIRKPFNRERRFKPGYQRALYSKVKFRCMARVRLEVLEKKLFWQSADYTASLKGLQFISCDNNIVFRG